MMLHNRFARRKINICKISIRNLKIKGNQTKGATIVDGSPFLTLLGPASYFNWL